MLHYCLAALPSGFYSTWLLFYQLSSVDACWLGFCLFGFCLEGDVFVVLRYLQHFVKFLSSTSGTFCSALSGGFTHLHLIYTASVISEQFLEKQQEYFSVQYIVNRP